MPSTIFVRAGCIVVHDECEFIYGQGLWICIQGMQVNIGVGVYVKCVSVNASCEVV